MWCTPIDQLLATSLKDCGLRHWRVALYTPWATRPRHGNTYQVISQLVFSRSGLTFPVHLAFFRVNRVSSVTACVQSFALAGVTYQRGAVHGRPQKFFQRGANSPTLD